MSDVAKSVLTGLLMVALGALIVVMAVDALPVTP